MSRSAILFFHQSAADDFRSQSGSFTRRQFQRLHQWQLRRTYTLLQSLAAPVFDLSTQKGATFGERLTFCLEQIHRQGYDRVLVLGRDCPTLPREDLVRALEVLEEGKACLGPDCRGGAYLMSFLLDAQTLRGLAEVRWQTTHVLTDLQQLFPQANLLATRRDINALSDIFHLKNESKHTHWVLLCLMSVKVPQPGPALCVHLTTALPHQLYLRPPPACV